MANKTTDLTAKLKVELDKSSLNQAQKELAKKDFQVKTSVVLDNKTALQSLQDMIDRLHQSVTELKELDTYLTKISKTNITLPISELAKIGENSFKDTSSNSGLNGLLSTMDEITQKVKSLAKEDLSKTLFNGIKNFGRPKMSGLCFEICRIS